MRDKRTRELLVLRKRMSDLKLNLFRLAERQRVKESQAIDAMTPTRCYECSICWNVNHFRHFHCSVCGTIPTMYSWIRQPARILPDDVETEIKSTTIPVYIADGCERQVSRRTIKRHARTVPADYYAERKESESV
jgi:hypothetical protein